MALDYSIIGERLKRARLAKNMTQEKPGIPYRITWFPSFMQ